MCACTPQDTVATLKTRITRALALHFPTIDQQRYVFAQHLRLTIGLTVRADRPMGSTVRLSYSLQQRNNASQLFEQHSKSFSGILGPDMDHLTLEELGIRNADECRLSLTCDHF